MKQKKMYVKPEEVVVKMNMQQNLLTQSNEELSRENQMDSYE